MTRLVQFLIAGLIIMLAIKVFKFESELTDKIIAGIKTRDPQQLIVMLALTILLGMVGLLAAQAFRKVV